MVAITGQYTRRLAEYAAGLTFDAIPKEIVEHVKRIVLNQFSATLWGWRIDSGTQVYRVMKQMGGAEEAVVIGSDSKLPVANAAAANATLAWSPMTDDTHLSGLIHSGHATVQPALAEGEAAGIAGRDFITAVVAANEVGIRIGHAVSAEQDQEYNINRRGWWGELKNAFPAAVASAKVQNLSAGQMAHALGIAATSTSGLHWTGESIPHSGSVFPWDAGKAVMGGIIAARLAAGGMTDGPDPLEGEKGWVRTYTWGHGRLEWLTQGLGETFETGRISLKTRCNSAMVHLPIDTAYELVKENGITADQVQKVTVRGQQWLEDFLWRLDVQSYQDAIFSLPFSMALVMLEPGSMTFPDQVVSHLGDPAIQGLMSRFELEVDESEELATQMPATVTIRTTDGSVFSKHSGTSARGNYPENPLEPIELETKFRRSATGILEDRQVERALELVYSLDQLSNVGDLARTLRQS